MSEPEIVDPESLTDDELYAAFWEAGDLSMLMHAGQLRLRDHFHNWRLVPQIGEIHEVGSIPLIYGVEGGKRFGKTTCALWICYEFAVWYAQTFGRPAAIRYTSAWQKTCDEIIGSVTPQCFRTAPASCEPTYHGKRGIRPAGLYFPEHGPTLGARIALAGLDMHPDALRGQGNDLDMISEAAFITALNFTIRNVLIHQYHGKPWGRMLVETSAPRDLDTDWETVILPDCKKRGAVFSATIEDNPLLSRAEKDFWIGVAGGRGHPDCEAEYFNVIAADPKRAVFPDFDRVKHVREVEIPRHAYTVTIADPGQVDQFALLFACLDFDQARLIVQDSWAESNAGSMKVAAIVAAREFALWGAWPHPRMKRIPLEEDEDSLGWKELLSGDRCEHLAEKLHEMANTSRELRPDYEKTIGQFIVNDIPGMLTHWDDQKSEHRPPPGLRISDVDKQLIRDIDDHYGLSFMPTSKSELITMTRNARNWLADGRVVFLPESGPVIDHVRAARWPDNKTRNAFDRHPTYAHFDLGAAFVYLTRAANSLQEKRPHPPADLERSLIRGSANIQGRVPWSEKTAHELELERRLKLYGVRSQARLRPWK